jgi:hypothetical protein
MKHILNEKNRILFTGPDHEMELAHDYLTKPSWYLAEKRGLTMLDLYRLNEKYWNSATRESTLFRLVNA